ncbi:MAG: hypothetical protein ACOYKA_03005 [Legionellaceae bacterium]
MLLPLLIFFPPVAEGNLGDKNTWACTCRDKTELTWTIKSPYQRMAMNKALEECRKESVDPSTCKTALESCEFFLNQKSNHPLWRCTALDDSARPYISTIYSQMDEAALGAKINCTEHSAVPDSCTVNTVTCHDLNEVY